MTLDYAGGHLRTPKRRPSRASTWGGVMLVLIFPVAATLCVRAIRWDRWANYESQDRRWWHNLPGESYASFKAWRAWRASWERASLAAAISGGGMMVALGFIALARLRGRATSRWLVAALFSHGLVVAYFFWRWGPDFGHPYYRWTG